MQEIEKYTGKRTLAINGTFRILPRAMILGVDHSTTERTRFRTAGKVTRSKIPPGEQRPVSDQRRHKTPGPGPAPRSFSSSRF
jgi:hypothetical protein